VAVSPRARRQGVAVTLVRRAEAVAAAWGCSKAALNVNETNTAAVALYRCGGGSDHGGASSAHHADAAGTARVWHLILLRGVGAQSRTPLWCPAAHA
jgi:hypothetical protein